MNEPLSYKRISQFLKSAIFYAGRQNGKDFNLIMFRKILSAVDKQIPEKPTPHIVNVEKIKIGKANWCKGTTIYKCPRCDNYISRLYDYCYKCGQAIDWSGNDA